MGTLGSRSTLVSFCLSPAEISDVSLCLNRTKLNLDSSSSSRPEPTFALTLDPVLSPEATAEPTELACRVTNITHLPASGRLGVSWEYATLPGA